MNKLEYEGLLDTFTKQLEFTKELINTAQFKLSAIKDNNTDLLMEITNKEEQFAREIIQLEKKRDAYIKNIEQKEKKKITNISEIVERLSVDKAVKLTKISEELKYNLEILKEKNNINQDMMIFILDQIEIANNLIIGERVPNTYDNTKFKKKLYGSNINNSYFDSRY